MPQSSAAASQAGPAPRDLGLTSSSFSNKIIETSYNTVLNVEAPQKVGKDHFALGAPGPIILFNFDNGLRGVIEKFRKHKTVIVAGVPTDKAGVYPSYSFAAPAPQSKEKRKDDAYLTRVRSKALPIWEKWIEDYQEFLESKCRTGIVDTGGAAFTLGKFAFMGMSRYTQKDDPFGQKSGEMKAIFQGLITAAYQYNKTVIWLHRVKDEWRGGAPTGKQEMDGYKQLPYEVEATIRLSKRQEVVEKPTGQTDEDGDPITVKEKVWVRKAEIRDCRINDPLNGYVASGPDATFPELMAQIYPQTEAEDWL